MTTNNNIFQPSLPINQIVKEINWPLLASIALHGIFFTTVFPQWFSQNKSVNSEGLNNTPIIELNSLEQTRLPNLNPSNSLNWNNLNPLPEVNNFDGLTIPLPPLENNSFDLPEVNNNIMYDDFAALPPPPVGMNSFSPPSIPQTSYDFEVSDTSPVDLPPPPPVNQNSLANLPPISDSETQINDINEANNSNPSSPFNRNIPVNQILDEERQAEIRRQLFANSPMEVVVNPRDVINNRDNKIDVKNDSLGMLGNENQLPTNSKNPLSSLTDKLAKNTENTSDEEARKNYIAWAKEVENISPQEVSLVGIYPKDACVKKIEGVTTYGITVNPMGNVVASRLIKSSGYNLFNEQALKQITARQFENNTNGNVPYHVYVNFQYDSKVCPSVSLSNLGDIPSSPSINSVPLVPNSNNIKPQQPSPSNSTSTKEPEQKSNPQSVASPTRVNNLATPSNSADTLKIPSERVEKPANPPQLPPIIESVPKKEDEERKSSAENTESSSNSSPAEEIKLDEEKSVESEVVQENNSQDSSQPTEKVD